MSILGLSAAWMDGTIWETALGLVMLALVLAMVGTMIWAVAERVRGSLVKNILLWIVAVPTVLGALSFVGLTIATVATPSSGGGDMGLVLIPLFLIVLGGLGILLILAALPKRASGASRTG
ncbi:hypothetical protein [Phenylobacterium sp.]|uniref:hypothetical protein n=1 Tax=Phenylobacterium sp. TaxID=1871053 RepID=UPI0035AEB4E5